MKRVLKRIFLAAFFLFLLGVAASFYLYSELQVWLVKPKSVAEGTLIRIEPGLGLATLSKRLEGQGVVSSAFAFKYWIKFFDDYRLFQAGLYRFDAPQTPYDVRQRFVSGAIFTPIALRFTVKEGSTISEFCALMHEKKVTELDDCLSYLYSGNILQSFGYAGESFEGYLYPATYSFTEKPNLQMVVQKIMSHFSSVVSLEIKEALKEKELDLYQGLIFASLIEREVAVASEYELVSEVIWNRLKRGIPLGIDAALIYGIKDYDGDITFAHLRDASNPYNTRIHKGLPPTPICSPSLTAVKAVLNPTNFGYYYYVHDIEKGRMHHFSKSLKEHNRYVEKLKRYTR